MTRYKPVSPSIHLRDSRSVGRRPVLWKYLIVCMLSVGVTGCTLGPDYQPPVLSFLRGDHFHADQQEVVFPPEITHIEQAWWAEFEDPLLQDVLQQVVQHNLSLRAAAANVQRARSLRTVATAGLWPSLSANGSAQRQGISRQGANNFLRDRERDVIDTSLDTAWELDLFGRLRRQKEAATADWQATEENRRALLLATLTEAASTYFQIRGLQRRLQIVEGNIQLLQDTEALVQDQVDAGIVSDLDVTRARGEKQATAAELPTWQAELQSAIYRLSVLAGQPPEHFAQTFQTAQPLPMPPDRVPVGLRSDVLTRRPDVRQAERQLAAETARIGVAKANLFPRFSLTGTLGYASQTFSDLMSPNAATYQLGGLLNWPLFQAGALTAQIEIADANAQAALANYEATALQALEDAEAALVRYAKAWVRLKQLRQAEQTLQDAATIARLRYEAGEESFLTVLDAQRSLNTIREQQVQAETDILVLLTRLYAALGGGWQAVDVSPAIADTQPDE